MNHSRQDGFTLLEVMVALGIVTLVITSVLAVRTNALIDASEARNWRVAREVAQEILSELSAGAREDPIEFDDDTQLPIPSMKDVRGWSYQIVVGEERIATKESELESAQADDGGKAAERRNFQRERNDLRKARASGMGYYEYREQNQIEEDERLDNEEDTPPSEDEFEQVAVFVFFPNVRVEQSDYGHFVLKARLSTLALSGETPEEAEVGNENSSSEGSGDGNSPIGNGNTGAAK